MEVLVSKLEKEAGVKFCREEVYRNFKLDETYLAIEE
jgi:hypothetical protein